MFSRRDASNTERDRQTSEDVLRTAPPTPTPTPQSTFAPATPVETPMAAANTDESLIAREDTFEGQLKTKRGVRVLGTVLGGIESEQYVHVEESAKVEADITAQEVVIAGEYSGKLTCRERVEIRSTGRVSGQIDTAKLLLHEGGYFDGELHMQRPDNAAAAQNKPAAATSTDDSRSRRTRYVDLSSESSSSREVGSESSSS